MTGFKLNLVIIPVIRCVDAHLSSLFCTTVSWVFARQGDWQLHRLFSQVHRSLRKAHLSSIRPLFRLLLHFHSLSFCPSTSPCCLQAHVGTNSTQRTGNEGNKFWGNPLAGVVVTRRCVTTQIILCVMMCTRLLTVPHVFWLFLCFNPLLFIDFASS